MLVNSVSILTVLYLVCCVFTHVNAYIYADGSCFTPLNRPGTCIILKNCPLLAGLLKNNRISPKALDFLRDSTCAFEGIEPKVCCTNDTFTFRVSPDPTSILFIPETNTRQPSHTSRSGFNLLPDDNECGLSDINKIVSGEVNDLTEFPWTALIEYQKPDGRGFHCGGVLISSRYVLTAAHCVKGKDLPTTWSLVSVRLGEYDLNNATDCLYNHNGVTNCAPSPQDIPIEEIIPHEQYDPNDINQYHDIALLRLSRDVSFTEFITPICLPPASGQSTDLWLSGWGNTKAKSESNVKSKQKVQFVDSNTYKQDNSDETLNLGEGQICANDQNGKSSCHVDSGGPLMTVYNNTLYHYAFSNWVAVGIFSFGPSSCSSPDRPGVYTKVESYRPWVLNQLRR